MKIIIDGDSAPLKEDIAALAEKNGIRIIIVTSIAHYTEKPGIGKAELVLVDNRPQEADIKIMNLAEKNDICITGDSGLAHILSGKGVTIVGHKGDILSGADIEINMERAHIFKKALRGKKRMKMKGPAARTLQDDEKLVEVIGELIKKAKSGEII
ncbi:MAG: DUF188 domain-containing protein [Candidatus Goldiibacteriota bacterium]